MTLDEIRKLYALHEKDGCIASSHEMWGMIGECLAEISRMESMMKQWALEAHEDVASWGAYASNYFQEKWDWEADMNKWEKRAKGEC